MGSVSGENGVLKLVYPGGFVELHKNPITAGEVMKRNPRHCVTRPDVFKFPWIVVRPESVLKPGRVFYVVPYHTIHRLLRSKDFSPRPKLDNNQAAEQIGNRRESQNNVCGHEDRSADYSSGSEYINVCRKQFLELKTQKESHESAKKLQEVKQWQMGKQKQVYNVYEDEEVQGLLRKYDERVELKSCLKKHSNNGKSRGFRVRFVLDDSTETV